MPQNNIIIFEQFIISYFFSGNISKARYYLTLIFQDLKVKENQFNVKLDYYLLVINFILGNYNENQKLLATISRSHKSFNIKFEIRVIEIINLIELNKYDLADSNIESLKKFMIRYGGELIRKNKAQVVVKIFSNLAKGGYSFNSVFRSNLILFNLLTEFNKKFDFNEYEMIPFHEWFDSKVKNVPYNHTEAMKRLKKLNKSKA